MFASLELLLENEHRWSLSSVAITISLCERVREAVIPHTVTESVADDGVTALLATISARRRWILRYRYPASDT